MSRWILSALVSAALTLAPVLAMAKSTLKSEARDPIRPEMVLKKHTYAQPVDPVIVEPASKPVETKNFAGSGFDCRPMSRDFNPIRCGY
jgi:hypothetical protein